MKVPFVILNMNLAAQLSNYEIVLKTFAQQSRYCFFLKLVTN